MYAFQNFIVAVYSSEKLVYNVIRLKERLVIIVAEKIRKPPCFYFKCYFAFKLKNKLKRSNLYSDNPIHILFVYKFGIINMNPQLWYCIEKVIIIDKQWNKNSKTSCIVNP